MSELGDALRAEQLQRALELISEASSSGRPLLLQIDGDIGIGKSVFLADLMQRARAAAAGGTAVEGTAASAAKPVPVPGSMLVVSGAFVPGRGSGAADRAASGGFDAAGTFEPLVETLLGDATWAAAGAMSDAATRAAADAATGDPAPAPAPAPGDDAADPETGRDAGSPASTAALATRCAAALGARGCALAVDDADRLGGADLEFLTALIAAPAAPPLALVLTLRNDLVPRPLLAAARARGMTHERIALEPLAGATIERIAGDLDAGRSEAIAQHAQGNPLFARVLRDAFHRHPDALDAAEALRRAEESRSAVLESAVAADIDSLPQHPRRVLETIAVLGTDLEHDVFTDIADVNTEQYASGLDELRARRLMPQHPDEPIHPVIRHSVSLYAGDRLRAELHRKAARLAAADAASRAEHLAHLSHQLTAEESHELAGIAESFATSDAITALRWVRAIPVRHRDDGADLLLARLLLATGAALQARQILYEYLTVHGRGDDDEAPALLASAMQVLGQHEEARSLLQSVGAEGALASHAIEIVRSIADTHVFIDGEVPRRVLDRLAALGGSASPGETAAQIYRITALLHAGEVRQARQLFRATAAHLPDASDDELAELLVGPLVHAAWAAYQLEDYEFCARITALGLSAARRAGRADGYALLETQLAFVLSHLGRLEEAEAHAEQALIDAQRHGPQGAAALASAALLLTARGRVSANPELVLERFVQLGEHELPVLETWRRIVLSLRARISAALGAPEYSPELLREPVDALTPQRYTDAARAAVSGGDYSFARQLLDQAVALAGELGLRGQQAVANTCLAELLLTTGKPLEARNLLVAAQPVFVELGMVLLQQQVRSLLAKVDGALTQRSRHFEALTQRELEVAELIAAGMKNRQIADRLVISQRTAENHVARVLRKLELESRQELIAKFGAELVPGSGGAGGSGGSGSGGGSPEPVGSAPATAVAAPATPADPSDDTVPIPIITRAQIAAAGGSPAKRSRPRTAAHGAPAAADDAPAPGDAAAAGADRGDAPGD